MSEISNKPMDADAKLIKTENILSTAVKKKMNAKNDIQQIHLHKKGDK